MKFRPFEGGGGGGGFMVATAISITEMPASVKVGVKFLVKGKLYRVDTKTGIQAAKVDVYPALEPLTSATTDSLGIFLAYVTIKEVGDLAVVVRFKGTDYSSVAEWFGACSTMKSIIVTNGVVPPTEYVCPVCGAKFASKADLDKHIALVHHPPPPPKVVLEEIIEWVKENPLITILLLLVGVVGGTVIIRRR